MPYFQLNKNFRLFFPVKNGMSSGEAPHLLPSFSWKNFRLRDQEDSFFLSERQVNLRRNSSEIFSKVLISGKKISTQGALDLDADRSQLDLSLALQKKNIFRLIFLFFLSLDSSSKKQNHIPKAEEGRKSAGVNLVVSMSSLESTLRFLKQFFRRVENFVNFFRQVLGIHKAALAIPYVFFCGIFFTFLHFQRSTFALSLNEVLKGSNINVFESFDLFLPSSLVSVVEKTGKQKISRVDSIEGDTLHVSSIDSGSSPLTNNLNLSWPGERQMLLFCFESLRIATLCSKVFLLWAVLQIWRGIRPGQSTFSETRLQLRILSPEENKKSLKDVQGIEKYQDILQVCIQSIRTNQNSIFLKFVIGFLQIKQNLVSIRRLISGAKKRSFSLENRLVKQNQLESSTKIPWVSPKAYLFLGPPGSGKTLCAQAIAGEAKLPLLCLSASEIQKQIESGTKIGAIRVRNLFKQTRAHSPCILFLDEIDSLAMVNKVDNINPLNSQVHGEAYSVGSTDQLFARFLSTAELDKASAKFGVHQFKSFHLMTDLGPQSMFLEKNQTNDRERLSWQTSKSTPVNSISSTDSASLGKQSLLYSPRNQQFNSSLTVDRTVLTEFLIQMDSFSIRDGFCVIGTTNFLDLLDSAFIRSGRFDRLLALSYPGQKDRERLFEFYSRVKKRNHEKNILSMVIKGRTPWGNFPDENGKAPGSTKFAGKRIEKEGEVDWGVWAEKTQGLSAADIAKIMNESFLYLIRKKSIDFSGDLFGFQMKKLRSLGPIKHTSESIQKGINNITARKNFV